MVSKQSRRTFLEQSGAILAGVAAPWVIPSRILGGPKAAPPSDRIRIGHIGVGNRGGQNLEGFFEFPFVDTVAVCEVDSARLAAAQKKVAKRTGKQCAAYSDYRKLLEDKNVDAVVITTPDHWHALPMIEACQAGKDVYCEKPLTLTIAEGQAMRTAARKYGRIVQTGSQQRSDAKFRRACELVRSGRIGKVHTIRAGISGVNFKGKPVANGEPPKELDYDFWLGPAPQKPYNAGHVHYNFRFFWDYSGGQMTNWGAHNLDIAQWGMGMDESGPISAEGKARFNKDHVYEVPEWSEVEYRYAEGTRMICGMSQKGGTTFEGSEGKISVSRKQLEASKPEIVNDPPGKDDVKLEVSDDHYGNWLECIRTRKLPICDVAIGHRSATVCHLGNIAIRSGKKVTWDPAKEIITGDSELAAMASRPYRAPWVLPTS